MKIGKLKCVMDDIMWGAADILPSAACPTTIFWKKFLVQTQK